MALLVTGGAGYIGTHTCVELLNAGFDVVVIDNLCNSKPESLARVKQITGKEVTFYQGDIRDKTALRAVFEEQNISAIVHFAGLKAVGESCEKPLWYYDNNVSGTVTLCEVMGEYGVKHLLFSSSATVYGDPATIPITEDFPTQVANPYGRSKRIVEEILADLCAAQSSQHSVGLLRYFNPIGAHPSGLIGEDPQGIPNNLLPYISQVASGKLEKLRIFGDDYPTPDGTGIRDYIHVVDLARGHLMALQKLLGAEPGCYTYNLGTGKGHSVLEVLKTFEKVCGKEIPYEVVERRSGDVAEYFADPSKALKELGWQTEFDLLRMIEDTWRWQKNNPYGY